MLDFFMFKQCIGCSFKGVFLCLKCKNFLLKKKNIRLFEIEENNIINKISLYEFNEMKNKIRIIILYDYFKMLDFLICNPDKYRLKEVFELLEQQLKSLFNYQSLKELNFFSKCKMRLFYNDFIYNFMKFLKKKHDINYYYKFSLKKFLKKENKTLLL